MNNQAAQTMPGDLRWKIDTLNPSSSGVVSLTQEEWAYVVAALSQTAGVAEGWKLVPVEPTEAMMEAAMQREDDEPLSSWGKIVPAPHDAIYRAMLAAAPDELCRSRMAGHHRTRIPVHRRRAVHPSHPLHDQGTAMTPTKNESLPEPMTASMCPSPDYAKGWNDCLAALTREAPTEGDDDEWLLVPKIPTQAMIAAGDEIFAADGKRTRPESVYDAMVHAATAPAPQRLAQGEDMVLVPRELTISMREAAEQEEACGNDFADMWEAAIATYIFDRENGNG